MSKRRPPFSALRATLWLALLLAAPLSAAALSAAALSAAALSGTALPGAAPPAQAAQQAQPEVLRSSARLDFPDTVTFDLELANPAAFTGVTLVYDLAQFSCLDVPSRVPLPLDGARVSWEWVMSRSGNPPPGAELWWQWELARPDGSTVTTARQTLSFVDDRFTWQTVSAAGISVSWYDGADVGPLLLDAAVSGLQTLEEDLGITLQNDVQLYIYGTSQAMRDAVLYIQDWAGGVAFDEYNVILMGVPPNIAADWGRRTVRHELAHLVLGQFGRSCVGGSRPTWLEEGVAMVVEGEPDSRTRSDLAAGADENGFAPLRSLNGAFPAHDSGASMAYSQSYSVVNFLLAEYGTAALQELVLALADGDGVDEALTAVIGSDLDGLEAAWRASLALPPRQAIPTPTPITAAQVPTLAPQRIPRSVPTPPAAAQPPPALPDPSSGLCGFGLIPLFLLIWRPRKRPNP